MRYVEPNSTPRGFVRIWVSARVDHLSRDSDLANGNLIPLCDQKSQREWTQEWATRTTTPICVRCAQKAAAA